MDSPTTPSTPQAPTSSPSRSSKLGDILVRLGIITTEQYQQVLKECDPSQNNIGQVCVALGFTTEEKISKAVSVRLGIPYFPTFEGMVDPSVAALVPEALSRKHLIVPILKSDNSLTIGMVNPVDVLAIDEVARASGLRVLPVLTSLSNLLGTITEVYAATRAAAAVSASEARANAELAISMASTPIPRFDESSVVTTVETMLREGVTRKASDVHLEISEKRSRSRFRVDGLLQDGAVYERNLHPALVARLKILAHLDITETRLPQDGHLRYELSGRPVDIRMSTVPGIYGEKVVLRILDSSQALKSLTDLGLSEANFKAFSHAIQQSSHLILVTGPTGSGKTTTLYAALSQLNNESTNIVTLEDPVEYRVDRITQIETLPKIGLTFAAGLRSILRQDPNVILVGEIRDVETAETAIQAAITGHSVFSTLHTSDAASAVHRLITMNVEPFLIAAALGGVMAQRLSRRLCDACKRPQTLTDAERSAFGGRLPEGVTFYEPIGCGVCFRTGYAGRFAVHEWLPITRGIKDLILRREGVDVIRDAARSQGMKTLQEDALAKATTGWTSLAEVLRITERDSD